MSKLFTTASSFAAAISNSDRNCYWYGAATAIGEDIVPRPAANPCGCNVPPRLRAAGADVGWPSPDGFALAGWDAERQPLAYTDCTGFAATMIARTSSADFDVLRAWDGRNRQHFVRHDQPWPSAAAYAYAGYAADPIGGNWSVVVNAAAPPLDWTQHVQPGDLLAWDIQEVRGQVNDTGHILILSAAPQLVSGSQYKVSVIDCSRLLHGDDSRPPGTTGVGTGFILLEYTGGTWQYSFGTPNDNFHSAPHISVLRLNG